MDSKSNEGRLVYRHRRTVLNARAVGFGRANTEMQAAYKFRNPASVKFLSDNCVFHKDIFVILRA